MPGTNESDDFYEEDEPVEDVAAAFEAGPHGLTAPPLVRLSFVAETANTLAVYAPVAAGWVTGSEQSQNTGTITVPA